MTTPDRLLLFLRYPQAGHSKTRLIPALGAVGAAQLQRQMAEYLLHHLHHSAWQIQVQFTGTSVTQMRGWLGSQLSYPLSYQRQCTGDLGDRIQFAFQQGFAQGCDRLVAIGADCPDLSAHHIQKAFSALCDRDMVLGPATDGGYYLIGLRNSAKISQSLPLLFDGIAWSTPYVFQQTQNKAHQLQLSYAQLEVLSDIDRPEDLPIWHRLQTLSAKAS